MRLLNANEYNCSALGIISVHVVYIGVRLPLTQGCLDDILNVELGLICKEKQANVEKKSIHAFYGMTPWQLLLKSVLFS